MAHSPNNSHLITLDAVDSTNEEARRRIKQGTPPGTVICAREQSAGRGRRGRPWSSPQGNLYISLALQPDCSRSDAAQLSFLAGVVVAEVVAAMLPKHRRVTLKWPNDVLIDGCKTAGILLEGENDPAGGQPWVIVGIGINVESSPEGVPYPTTSLRQAGGEDLDITVLAETLLTHWSDWYARWETGGFPITRAAWLVRAHNLKGDIIAKMPRETVEGRFVDLDASGELVLETRSGRVMHINAADIYFPTAGTTDSWD